MSRRQCFSVIASSCSRPSRRASWRTWSSRCRARAIRFLQSSPGSAPNAPGSYSPLIRSWLPRRRIVKWRKPNKTTGHPKSREESMLTRRAFSQAVVGGSVASAIAPLAIARRSFAATVALKTVRLADQPGAEVDYAAVWIAEGLGYFEEQGIKIDRRSYANAPAAMLDFPSGSIDAVIAAVSPFYQFHPQAGHVDLSSSLTPLC